MEIHGLVRGARRGSFWLVLLLALLFPFVSAEAQTGKTLELVVLDAENGAPLPSVVLVSGKYHTLSDASGRVRLDLDHLSERDIVTFSLTGYDPLAESVKALKAKTGRPVRVYLTFSSVALEGVAVEAEKPLPSAVSVGERLGTDRLKNSVSESLAEMLSGVKGLSMISSGTTSSVPVIQGMSGERILVVANGVRQEGQQWNSDFGPDVDAAAAGSVTVLKGAESVRFGSDALGGVILVDEAPLPYGGRVMGGEVQTQFGSNGLYYGGRTMLEGALGSKKAFAYRVQGSYTNGGDRRTAKYILNNTGVRAYALQANLGWNASRYGAELTYALTGHAEGIMYEAKMGNVEQLAERIKQGRPLVELPFSRDLDYPKHEGLHQYVSGKGFYNTRDAGSFSLQIAYQRDNQDEYHYRRMKRSNIPSVSLTLDNVQGNFKWAHHYLGGWSTEAGVQAQYTNNWNQPGTGVVPLIPNYVETTGGLYLVQKFHTQGWGAEAGVRGDLSYLNALGIDAYSQTYGGERTFKNFTYSVGAHYHFTPRLRFVTNFGTAWRAPHVGELFSNGIDATGSLYLKGDSTMTSERSNKWIASLTYSGDKFTVGVEGYLTWIDGYIYKEPTGENFTVISGVYPLFRYRQTSATIHGADAELSWQVAPWLRYRVTGGMIWAAESGTGRYLPYIPPFRLSQELSFDLPFWEKSFVELGHRYVAEQKRFDPATDLVPFAPSAYHLYELRAGSTLRLGKRSALTFLLSIENLFNLEYKEYTNLARYYSHEAGRDIRVSVRYSF